MAINVQYVYNITVGFSRHYTGDPMLLPSGNPFKCHEEVLSLQPMIPPNLSGLAFPPDWAMLRRSSRCVQILYYVILLESKRTPKPRNVVNLSIDALDRISFRNGR